MAVSVSSQTIPHYVVLSSPDVWNGQDEVQYFTYFDEAYQGYSASTISRRDELPFTPNE